MKSYAKICENMRFVDFAQLNLIEMCGVSPRGNTLEILEIVKAYYGVVDCPYDGVTYILPDGAMLDMRGCNHHSDVEKFLVDSGLSNEPYTEIGGSNACQSPSSK